MRDHNVLPREPERGRATELTAAATALSHSNDSETFARAELAQRADSRRTALWLYVVVCTVYYVANFVLRWQHYMIFSGHGAYGWSEPSPWQRAGMFLALVAGPLQVFAVATMLLRMVLAKRAWLVIVPLAALWLCFAEVDATWYNVSGEHVRWVDVDLFIGLDVKAHLGVDANDMTSLLAACAMHVVVACVSGIALARTAARRPALLTRRWLGPALQSSFLTVLVLGNWASFWLSPQQFWRQISRSYRLNATMNEVVRKSEPESRVLAQRYQRLATGSAVRQQVASAAASTAARPARILVIAIEGWHPDFVNDSLMPRTAEFRRHARQFVNHYSSGNNTLLGTLGLLYGQSPTFYFNQEATGQRSAFLDELRRQGYRTKLFGDGLTSYRFIDSYLRNFSDPGDFRGVGDSILNSISSFVRSGPRTFAFYYYVKHTLSVSPRQHLPGISSGGAGRLSIRSRRHAPASGGDRQQIP